MAQEGQTPSMPRLRQSGVLTSTLSSPGRAVCASTWVVSGGLGGLGLRAASMLIDVGVFSAVLCSRSGNIKQADQALLRQLAARDASCALCCDVGDAADVAGVVWRTTSLGRPASVLHAAGVLSDSLVRAMAMRHFACAVNGPSHGPLPLLLTLPPASMLLDRCSRAPPCERIAAVASAHVTPLPTLRERWYRRCWVAQWPADWLRCVWLNIARTPAIQSCDFCGK